MKLIEKISQDLGLPEQYLSSALLNSRRLVKRIKIIKRDGNERVVYQPSKKIKVIQYWLISNVFQSIRVHSAATAYSKGKSIKHNLLLHKKNRFFLKLDFCEFFPSITYDYLSSIVDSWLKDDRSHFNSDELKQLIKLVCFYKNDRLPIGYPSSPIISNIVMYNFDLLISSNVVESGMYGEVKYSRYADDMVFSTNKQGACQEIKNCVMQLLIDIGSPTLKLNEQKTRYLSSSGGSALVTGLRLCYDTHMTVHRKYKDEIRRLFYCLEKGLLSEKEKKSLKGHLSYLKYVDGQYYSKLISKYFDLLKNIPM